MQCCDLTRSKHGKDGCLPFWHPNLGLSTEVEGESIYSPRQSEVPGKEDA